MKSYATALTSDDIAAAQSASDTALLKQLGMDAPLESTQFPSPRVLEPPALRPASALTASATTLFGCVEAAVKRSAAAEVDARLNLIPHGPCHKRPKSPCPQLLLTRTLAAFAAMNAFACASNVGLTVPSPRRAPR
jgi:hypothetical protein